MPSVRRTAKGNKSRPLSDKGRENYDRIFKKKVHFGHPDIVGPLCETMEFGVLSPPCTEEIREVTCPKCVKMIEDWKNMYDKGGRKCL